MKKAGNSNIKTCIENLLATFKNEVPYARDKGIRHETLDLPAEEVEQQLVEDAELVMEAYEERVSVEETEVDVCSVNGIYQYHVKVAQPE